MELRRYMRNNVLKLSAFATLAILAIVLTTLFLPQAMAGDCCGSCEDYCDCCGDDGNCCDKYDCCHYDKDCCEEEPDCSRVIGEIIPLKPSGKFERETLYAHVKIRNKDDEAHHYDFSVYICEADCSTSCDVTDCKQMVCDSSHLFLIAGQTKYVKCARFVRDAGFYRIKVDYKIDCSGERAIYSEKFEVMEECGDCYSCGTCESDKDYRCFGNFLQKRYRDENCDWRWKIVEYCPYGCEDEKCMIPDSTTTTKSLGEPKVFMPRSYELDKCEISSFTFSLQNKGKADTFKLGVEGDAADWIDAPSLVEIGEGEIKRITAYATVPCEAGSGFHRFTITATGKTTDSATGTIKIEKAQGLFVTGIATDLLLVLLVIFVFVLAIWYRDKFGFERPVFGKKPNYKEPEEFKPKVFFKQKILKNLKINQKGD